MILESRQASIDYEKIYNSRFKVMKTGICSILDIISDEAFMITLSKKMRYWLPMIIVLYMAIKDQQMVELAGMSGKKIRLRNREEAALENAVEKNLQKRCDFYEF